MKLFDLALKKYKEDNQFAINCMNIAMRLKRKYNIKLPKILKNVYCKNCYSPLVPPHNVKTRIHKKGMHVKIVKICMNCGKIITNEIKR